MTGILLYLAIHRIINQDFDIHSEPMLIVSSIGLGMNLLMMFVLADGLGDCFTTFFGFCCLFKRKRKNKIGKNSTHVQLDQQEPTTPSAEETKGEPKLEAGLQHEHSHVG